MGEDEVGDTSDLVTKIYIDSAAECGPGQVAAVENNPSWAPSPAKDLYDASAPADKGQQPATL